MDFVEFIKIIILGIIEGITEWLPISSTGHLLLAEQFLKLNVSEEVWNVFLVVIQFGAILAVVLIFWDKIWPFSSNTEERVRKPVIALVLEEELSISVPAPLNARYPARVAIHGGILR